MFHSESPEMCQTRCKRWSKTTALLSSGTEIWSVSVLLETVSCLQVHSLLLWGLPRKKSLRLAEFVSFLPSHCWKIFNSFVWDNGKVNKPSVLEHVFIFRCSLFFPGLYLISALPAPKHHVLYKSIYISLRQSVLILKWAFLGQNLLQCGSVVQKSGCVTLHLNEELESNGYTAKTIIHVHIVGFPVRLKGTYYANHLL